MIKASTGHYVSAVAVSPTSSDIIAVGHNDGAVYVTTNGTSASPTWTKVDDNGTALPGRMVTSITFSAARANTLWVTFGGYDAQNIWESTDLGGGWWPLSGIGVTALPSAPIYDLKVLSSQRELTLCRHGNRVVYERRRRRDLDASAGRTGQRRRRTTRVARTGHACRCHAWARHVQGDGGPIAARLHGDAEPTEREPRRECGDGERHGQPVASDMRVDGGQQRRVVVGHLR